jgi:uncharacterized protein (DUF488 family)
LASLGEQAVPQVAAVLTAGVYGADAAAFFAALEAAPADVLLDIRTRRAVRGPRYSYANAKRLTAELAHRGIAYRHVLALAPGRELLALQHAVDARERHTHSARAVLAPEYVRRYTAEVLDRFDFAALARELTGYRAPVLFCIERTPAACHRSLVAPRLAQALHAPEIVDLFP